MKKMIPMLAAVWVLGACSSPKAPNQEVAGKTDIKPQPVLPFAFVKDAQGAEQIGKGKVGYRFALLEPNTRRSAVSKPFALAHRSGKLPFANTADGIYFGKTDDRGLTPVFLFENAVAESDFVLVERVGKGKNGGWLTLSNNGQPMVGVPYTLNICAKRQPYQYHGVTNTLGQTVYVAEAKGTKVHITPFTNDAAAQKATLARLCTMAKPAGKKTAGSR